MTVLQVLAIAAAAAAVGAAVVLIFVGEKGGALTEGKALYLAHCASCHGISLEGEADWQSPDQEGFLPAPPHDETGHTWHHDRDLLIAITKFGVAEAAGLGGYQSKMPAFVGVLSDREIEQVIDWIESRWPDEIRARRAR